MANKLQKLVVTFFILALCIGGAPAWGQEEAKKTPADLRDEKFAAIQKELAEKSDEEKIKESKEILDDLSRTIKAEELDGMKSQIHIAGYFAMVKSFIPIIQAYRPLIDCERVFQDMKNNRLIKLGSSAVKPLEGDIQKKIIEKGYISEKQFCGKTKGKYLRDISYYVKKASQTKSRVKNEYKKALWKKLRSFKKSAIFTDNLGKNFEKIDFLPAQLQSDTKKIFYTPPQKVSRDDSAIFEEGIFKKKKE